MFSEYPELQELLKQIELRYGEKVKTSVDFECLSEDITFNTKQIISSSTLKRIWGYVDYKFLPRESTLDVLISANLFPMRVAAPHHLFLISES